MRTYDLYIAGTLQARWSWFSTAADPFEDATVKVGSAPRAWWPLTEQGRNLDPWDVETHDLFGLIGSQGWELVSADSSRAVAFPDMYVGDYTGTGSRPVSRLWTFKRAKN